MNKKYKFEASADKAYERNKELIKNRIKKGLCLRCTNRVVEGYRHCQFHLEYVREYSRLRKHEIAIGIRTSTPRKNIHRKKSYTQFAYSDTIKKYKKEKRKKGLCYVCLNKAINKHTLCYKHLRALKEYYYRNKEQ